MLSFGQPPASLQAATNRSARWLRSPPNSRSRTKRFLSSKHLFVGQRLACQVAIHVVELRFGGGVDEEAVEQVEEVVARGALNRPLRQAFVVLENLLDVNRGIAGRLPQSLQVGRRVAQAVDVVDAQPVDASVLDETEDETVHVVEHGFVLDAQADEAVDVEEAPVVDLPRGRFPVDEPVMLPLEQRQQGIRVVVQRLELRGVGSASRAPAGRWRRSSARRCRRRWSYRVSARGPWRRPRARRRGPAGGCMAACRASACRSSARACSRGRWPAGRATMGSRTAWRDGSARRRPVARGRAAPAPRRLARTQPPHRGRC